MPTAPFALVRYVLYGVLMGGADVIPGVSGGTMALIVGIYERLVGALSSAVSFGLAVLRLDLDAARRHWTAVPWGLIVPLLMGIGGAIVAGAAVIPPLMDAYPAPMRGLFFGLVAASLLIPARRIERLTGPRIGIGVACAAGAFFLTGLPALAVSDPGLIRVFCSAMVAICAMILPGVSGAFLLEALGIYAATLEALTTLDWAYVLTFCAGAAVGLGAFATLLDALLTHRHDATMAALVGLIAGALRALWPYGGADRVLRGPEAGEPVLSVVLLALVGFGSVCLLLVWSTPDAEREESTASPS
jgi:putative membrane protein